MNSWEEESWLKEEFHPLNGKLNSSFKKVVSCISWNQSENNAIWAYQQKVYGVSQKDGDTLQRC